MNVKMRLNIQTERMTDKTGFSEISKNIIQKDCFINDAKWKTITRGELIKHKNQ